MQLKNWHRSIFISILILFVFAVSYQSFTQESGALFFDNFEDYENGSNGSPIWTISKGMWIIEDGRFIQRSNEYDCGAMIDVYLESSFQLKIKFRIVSGDPGAGFFFSSEKLNSTAFSQMVRFDSKETMLLGRFVQGEYQCNRSIRFSEKKLDKFNWLILKVNQDDRTYSISLNDENLLQNEPLLFSAGYCGIQTSGGAIEFEQVELNELPQKNKHAALSWIRNFTINRKNQIVIPQASKGLIRIINQKGKPALTFGKHVDKQGQLAAPAAIVQMEKGNYIVTDVELNRVNLFDKKGRWKKAVGFEGGATEQFRCPVYAAVDDQNRIYIVEKANHRIQVFDRKLDFITSFGSEELEIPVALANEHEQIFVLNNGANTVEVFVWDGNKPSRISNFPFGYGQGRDIAVKNEKIFVSVANKIRSFNREGELIKEFAGESIGGICPYGLKFDSKNNLIAADFLNERFLIIDENLSEPEPVVEFPSSTEAVICFSNIGEKTTEVEVTHNDSVISKQSAKASKEHFFKLNDLKPSTLYHLKIFPSIEQIPFDDTFSKSFPLVTPPVKGKKHYWSIPMVTIIFTNVLDTSKMKSSMPNLPDLPKSELNRIKSQVEDGILFYWMNSGMNLFIDNEFIVVDDYLFKHELFGQEWWYPPVKGNVEKYVQGAGKEIDKYKAVLYMGCVRDYNEKKGVYELRGRGGGFTAGLGANGKYGLSYWEVTHANHNSGNNWLMVHEFHHQLDELFLLSGYPEYMFNHFSPTVNSADDFGEHFDGNAWILKNWDSAKWYDLKYGEMRFVADRDMDGIPDDAMDLPMDEVRLNSSPIFADFDGDGIADLDELSWSNWIIEGCGETYGGKKQFSNILNPDTDNDGILDSLDVYPLYPFEPVIHLLTESVTTDSLEERKVFARLVDNRIHAEVYAGWDSSDLSFVFEMDRLAPVKLMIDANADGWFLGRDNCLIYLTPKNDSTINSKAEIINCSDPVRWPFHDKQLAKQLELNTFIQKIHGGFRIDLKIPVNEYLGLTLTKNEIIGINIGFKVIMDDEGNERYVTVFEPHRFFDVKLIAE